MKTIASVTQVENELPSFPRENILETKRWSGLNNTENTRARTRVEIYGKKTNVVSTATTLSSEKKK